MSIFDVFDPGMRHLRQERDRQKMLVSKPTHGGGAPLGIDLEAGVAKIRIARPAPPAEVVDEATQEPADAGSEPEASDPGPADSAPTPTDPGSDSR